MNRFVLPLLFIGAFFLWPKIKSNFLPSGKLPPSFTKMDSPCLGKKMCSVIYVAPWCPACKDVAPILTDLLKNAQEFNRDVGIMVVVGEGQAHENQQLADSFGRGSLIDHDRSILKSLDVSYYPTFVVVDASFKIVKKDQEAFQWAIDQFGK